MALMGVQEKRRKNLQKKNKTKKRTRQSSLSGLAKGHCTVSPRKERIDDAVEAGKGALAETRIKKAKAVEVTNSLDKVFRCVSKLPKDYVFVPSGSLYMTLHCRKNTQASGRAVYATQRSTKTAAIYVPRDVFTKVDAAFKATADTRAKDKQRREDKLRGQAQAVMRRLYPFMPRDDEAEILQRAFRTSSGCVGRTRKLSMENIVGNAAQARIRHANTDYDQLLRSGVDKKEAREKVRREVGRLQGVWKKGHVGKC